MIKLLDIIAYGIFWTMTAIGVLIFIPFLMVFIPFFIISWAFDRLKGRGYL